MGCAIFLASARFPTNPRSRLALVVHKDEAGKKQHEAMGFHEGWNKALDQLVTYVKTM